jgi:hypothetical protein
MMEDPPSSEEIVRKCLENVYHAARKFSAPSQINSAHRLRGIVPKWEAAKQWFVDAPSETPMDPLSTTRSQEIINKCLENVYNAACEFSAISKISSAHISVAQYPSGRQQINGLRNTLIQSMVIFLLASVNAVKSAHRWHGKAADWSYENVEHWLDSLGQISTDLYLASKQLLVSHPNATAGVLLSVTFWPLPLIIFRQVLSLLGFGIQGITPGQ